MMPNDVFIEGINDSKLLNEEEREMLYEALVSHPKVQVSVTTMQSSDRPLLWIGDVPDHIIICTHVTTSPHCH